MSPMTMPAEDEIDMMMLFQLLKNVGGMGEEQRVASLGPGRKAVQIRPVERGIVDSHNGQLTFIGWKEGGLIDQERELMPIGEFGIMTDGHTAVMVMVSESHEHRSDGA